MKIENFINGEHKSQTATFKKLNPFTNEILYTVASASVLDLVQTIQFGQKAYSEWKQTALIERLTYLDKIKSEYINSKTEIIKSESTDQGLPLQFTESANYAIGLNIIDKLKAELNQNSDIENKRIYSATGLIAIILSWNLSNRLFIERTLAAIMAGNTVIIKCSSMAPSTAQVWSQIFKKINLPPGVVQFIHTNEQSVKDLLVTHPGIKAVSFVGTLKNSSDILKKVSSISFNQFKKIQIATGTKNAAIVLTEPSENLAHEVFDSFMIGQGQLAWNSARLFITEKNAAAWSELLVNYLQKQKRLESPEQNNTWTPILKKSSIQTFNEIKKTAAEDQAKLIFENQIVSFPENYLLPTFTKDMSNCSALQQDQVMAPLYIMSEVKYAFDIPKYSNVSYYGHGASVWSEFSKAEKIINNLDVGQVSLNQWLIYSKIQNSAVKQSAFGQQDYHIFGDFFSNAKSLS